jgi:endonuclease-3
MIPPDQEWDSIFDDLRLRIAGEGLPSVSQVAADNPRDPFRVLISTMISLRTRDDVTFAASGRLFRRAGAPREMAALSEEEIAALIFPAGFYRTKAVHIREAARVIHETWKDRIPPDRDLLMTLPGVGRKTANLVLNLGFGIDAVCVDTHVHRIANRTGWVRTKTPEKTETALEEILPKRYWIAVNGLLVSYGKAVCTPLSPRCGSCPLFSSRCERRGVGRSRE